MRRFACLAAVALALAAGPGPAAEIGSVAAVNLDVTGTPPAAGTRVLRLSDRVMQNERIVSSESGSAQLLFLDQTSLTVSPQSDIVLDSYVFDPERDAGQIAVGMTQGVLRFIGGRITKQSDGIVRTPVATVGIRGGIAMLVVTDDLVRILHAAGEYTRASCPGGGASACKGPPVTVSRPNAIIEVRPGEAPRYVGTASPQDVGEILGALSGIGDGGARTTDQIVAAFGRGEASAVPTGGNAPHQNPISTSGESRAAIMPLDPALETPGSDTQFRTLAFSDPRFLDEFNGGAPGGGFVDVGGQGEVRGQLVWTNDTDLDLHLFLPEQAGHVFFGNPTVVFNDGHATASLDFDNLGGTINVQPDLRVENIVVNGVVPPGIYNFEVDYFSGNQTTSFALTMTPDGGITSRTVTGSLAPGETSGLIPLVVPGQGGS